ncbi:low molecular weight protein-tyrosine-phosphatase [Paraoerskovia marina]|nr:low molecular weight protein-tyrosine-phosphatase [Paraoerskovia marina]
MTTRIMTVCTGNICRSPMAEVVLRSRLADAGLDDVVVDSTGVSGEEHGNPVDPRARRVLREHGYEVPDHAARQVSAEQLGDRDLVLPMTAQHARVLRRLAASAGVDDSHVVMYRAFDPSAPASDGDSADLDIADPWYGDQDGFVECLAQIEAAADGVVERVRALNGA